MKNKTYACVSLCFFAFSLFLWSCSDMELPGEHPPSEHQSFTLQDAKNYFRESTMNLVTARSTYEDKSIRLSAGDFSVNWDVAVPSSGGRLLCYDIPIRGEYHYKAVLLNVQRGTPTLNTVNVYQKLVIVKDEQTDTKGQFLLTLIPDADYERQHKGNVAKRFINASSTNDFSGVAIYSIPGLDLIVRANKYRDGKKLRGVFMSGTSEEMFDKIKQLETILGTFTLRRYDLARARSLGENTIIKDFERNGGVVIPHSDGWMFLDTDGSWFIMADYDGDGYPDTLVITPGSGGGGNSGNSGGSGGGSSVPDPDDYPDPEIHCTYCGSTSCSGECVNPGNGGVGSGGDSTPPQTPAMPKCENLADIKNYIVPYLENTLNCDFSGIKIINEEQCNCRTAYLRKGNSEIRVCEKFYKDKLKDQIPKVYHEYYHIKNDDNVPSVNSRFLWKPMDMPPPDIIECIRFEYDQNNPESSDYFEDYLRNEFLIIEYINHPKFYENEIKAYEEEMRIFPDETVTEFYAKVRKMAHWIYIQKHKVAKETFK